MLEEVESTQIFTDEEPENVMEVSLREFDTMVEDKKALDRLMVNPDFKRIILDKYIKDEAERLNGFLMSRNIQAIKDRDLIVAKIVAKGYLSHFVDDMVNALAGIDNPEQRLELIRQLDEMDTEEEGSDE